MTREDKTLNLQKVGVPCFTHLCFENLANYHLIKSSGSILCTSTFSNIKSQVKTNQPTSKQNLWGIHL